jgi:hypothetical protein
MNAPTRRAMLAGTSAALVAAGAALVPIPAAATHPVADNLDAALLAACAEFEQADQRLNEIFDEETGIADDAEAERAAEPLRARLAELVDAMDGMNASTEAGLRARIRLLSLHNGSGAWSWDDASTISGKLLRQVMREGGAGVPMAAGYKHSDAELFAACEQFARQEAEYCRLAIATDWPISAVRTPAMAALEKEFAALSEAHHANGFWIAEYSPKSLEGIRAKARAVLAYVGENDPTHDMIGALERSICFALAGDEGAA